MRSCGATAWNRICVWSVFVEPVRAQCAAASPTCSEISRGPISPIRQPVSSSSAGRLSAATRFNLAGRTATTRGFIPSNTCGGCRRARIQLDGSGNVYFPNEGDNKSWAAVLLLFALRIWRRARAERNCQRTRLPQASRPSEQSPAPPRRVVARLSRGRQRHSEQRSFCFNRAQQPV